jgi:hypothetical protein
MGLKRIDRPPGIPRDTQLRQPVQLAPCLQMHAEGNCEVTALCNWLTKDLVLGASVADQPWQEPFVTEAWLLDPESNHLLMPVCHEAGGTMLPPIERHSTATPYLHQ